MIDFPTWSELQSWVATELQNNEWFKTIGFFGVLTWLWHTCKTFPKYVWERIERRIIFSAHVYEQDKFYDMIEEWFSNNHKSSYRDVEIFYRRDPKPDNQTSHSDGDESEVIDGSYEMHHHEDLFFIWVGWRLIKVVKGREKMENANSIQSLYYNQFKISTFFGKRVVSKLLDKAFDAYQESAVKSKKLSVYFSSGHYWNKVSDVVPKPMSSIFLNKKQDVLDDISTFSNNQDWYADRAIPYRRGYLFYGPPGNGKTSLALSLAKESGRDLYVLAPDKDTDNNGLVRMFTELEPNSVLLIEDVDSTVGFGRNVEKGFDFSTILNCIDGVFAKTGVIVIFTTNHIDNLDSALMRSGRIDMKVEFPDPDKDLIFDYLERFYDQHVPRSGYDYVDARESVSMSDIQELCLQNRDSVVQVIKKIPLVSKKIKKTA